MTLTNDQYYGLNQMLSWWKSSTKQVFEIAGVVGTGTWDLTNLFIDTVQLDRDQVMFLSYDQKQVLSMASKRDHAYHLEGKLYKYERTVDFNSLKTFNPRSVKLEYVWEKKVRKSIDPNYELIVVFDSLLLNTTTFNDLKRWGVPILLIRDSMLLPSPSSCRFIKEPSIVLREPQLEYLGHPVIHFAHKVLQGHQMKQGNYDMVSVVDRRHMNMSNIKTSDMNIAMSYDIAAELTKLYRERILHQHTITNIPGERVILMEDIHSKRLVHPEEKNIKVYMTKGTIGRLTKLNRHAIGTKWVACEFTPDCYHEPFTELVIDRHFLNGLVRPTTQLIPDEDCKFAYAYALTPDLARLSKWDKVTLVSNNHDGYDRELYTRMMYTAITRANRQLTIVV